MRRTFCFPTFRSPRSAVARGRALRLAALATLPTACFLLAPGCGGYQDCKTLRLCPDEEALAGASGEGAGGAEASGGRASGGEGGSDGGSPAAGGEAGASGGATGSGGQNGGSGGEETGGGGGTGKLGGSGGEPAEDCSALECGEHGSCEETPEGATCTCEDGFSEADGSCQDIDECEDSPCGEGEVCENEPGSYSCSCAPGTYEDLGECWPDMVLVTAAGT